MKHKRLIWLVSVLLMMPSLAYGQPDPDPGPIGGLVYLLLAALGFGVFSLRKKKN